MRERSERRVERYQNEIALRLVGERVSEGDFTQHQQLTQGQVEMRQAHH